MSENERLQRINELELLWLNFYKNRYDLSEEQWKEYDKVMHEYMRLLL